LTTATLTQSDIENHDRYEASSVSFGASGSVGSGSGKQKADDAKPYDAKPDPKGMQVQAFQTGMNGATAGIGSASGNKGGTTRSGISAGTLTITDDKKQTALTGKSAEQTVAATNRDVVSGKDSGAVAKDWNGQKLKEEVTAQAQITQAFSPMAAKEIGTYAGNKEKEAKDNAEAAGKAGDTAREAEFKAEAAKWAEGGAYRVALHAAAGGVAGGVGGALGAGASAAAAPAIERLQEDAQGYLKQAGMESDSAKAVAKGVAGATAAGLGAVAGGTAGAAIGMNVDVNNRQLHPDETKWIQRKSKDFAQKLYGTDNPTEQQIAQAQAYLVYAAMADVDSGEMRANVLLGMGKDDNYIEAKKYLNGQKDTFINDKGQAQRVFTVQGNEFYDPLKYSKYNADPAYRDFMWNAAGINYAPPATASAQEKAVYEQREAERLKRDAKNMAIGLLPTVMAGVTGKVTANVPTPKRGVGIAGQDSVTSDGTANSATGPKLANDLAAAQAKDPRIGTTLPGANSPVKVTAESNIGGRTLVDTNQTARPVALADPNKPTLISDLVPPGKPNSTMANAHAEVGLIQQAYDAGLTKEQNMTIVVRGDTVCTYCQTSTNLIAAADRSGLNSLTVVDTVAGKAYVWTRGSNGWAK
jgi:hypothetical protein